MKYFIDGKEIQSNKDKQNLFLSRSDKHEDQRVTRTNMKYNEFLNFMEKLNQIIKTENSEVVRIAGDYSYLSLSLNGNTLSRKFEGWIELKES